MSSLAELLSRPRYEVFPFAGIADSVAEHVPAEVKLTVTSSPKRGLDATLEVAEELRRRGFEVVPHLSARSIADEGQAQELLDRLAEAGIDEVLVIAGDLKRPAGKFEGAADLLKVMASLRNSPRERGITGYPESHPFISDEETIEAMFAKEPFATSIVSQLCFDPATIVWWVGAVRERGTELPIYVGVPGVTPSRKLLAIATRIGVGESRRFLTRHGNLVARLVARRSGPDALLEGLADAVAQPRNRIAGFHFYTFNELAKTERWRRETLERLRG
jgi:methylenetetrahydrofolate reductase (NADPH)